MSSLALVPITNRNCILQDRQKEKKKPDLFREIFCRCSFQTPLFPEKTAIISRTVAFDPAASIAAEKVVPLLIFLSALELGRVKIVKPYHEVFFLPEEFLAYETPTTVAFEEALELSEEHRSDVATLKRLLLPKSHFINREMNRIKTRFEQITSYHYLILQLLDNPSSEKLETLYKQIVRGYLPEDASLVRSVDRFYEAYQEMEIGFSHEEFFHPILMLLREYKYPKRSLADLKNAFIQLQAYLQSFLEREFVRASNIFLKYALGNSRLSPEGAKAAFPFLRDLLFVEGEYVPSELFLTRCSQIIQQAEDLSELDSDSSSLDSIDAGDAKDCNEMRTFIQYFMRGSASSS